MRGFYPGRCPGLVCGVLSERFNTLVFYPDMQAVPLALREVEKPSNVLILAHAISLHMPPSNKKHANCPERATHTSLGQRPRNGIRPMISVLKERCINDNHKNLLEKTRSSHSSTDGHTTPRTTHYALRLRRTRTRTAPRTTHTHHHKHTHHAPRTTTRTTHCASAHTHHATAPLAHLSGMPDIGVVEDSLWLQGL